MADDKKAGWSEFRIRQTTDELFQHGPSLEIGIVALPQNGRIPIRALALLDTGAAGTAISPGLAERLAPNIIDKGEIHEAGREPVVASFYTVGLLLPAANVELEVAGLPSLAAPHDVLIGRDVLISCRLVIDFPNGVTALHMRSN